MKLNSVLMAGVMALASVGFAHAADFGGAYVGAKTGYSTTKMSNSDGHGWSGGIVTGYGITDGPWYFGGEIEGGLSHVSGVDKSASVAKKGYYTGAGRIGYKATDSVMAYGLLGLEGAQFDVAGASKTDWAYRYGVGVEGFVASNVSLRGEVNYVDWKGTHGLPGKGEWRTGVGASYHF